MKLYFQSLIFLTKHCVRVKSDEFEARGSKSSVVDGLDQLSHARFDVGVGKRVEHLVAGLRHLVREVSEVVTPDALGKFHVLLHHGHTTGVEGTKVGVLENSGQISLSRLL